MQTSTNSQQRGHGVGATVRSVVACVQLAKMRRTLDQVDLRHDFNGTLDDLGGNVERCTQQNTHSTTTEANERTAMNFSRKSFKTIALSMFCVC
jgi:hypothetical protein